jgi:hypothetical protein
MAVPAPLPEDDDALIADIARWVPGADDEASVRSLLAAWWRYAGVRNAAGAVVDSDRFLAERSSLGLLELPASVARTVIDLEFALLHAPKAAPAPASEPDDRPLRVVPSQDDDDSWSDTPALPAPVTVASLQASAARASSRQEAVSAERARTVVLAGLVVFFSLAVGVALIFGSAVPHLSIPGGADPLVAPWRAWLAIVTGVAGVAVATVIARRRGLGRALAAPRVGLGALALAGLGLLGGSIVTAGAGGVVLVAASATGALRR